MVTQFPASLTALVAGAMVCMMVCDASAADVSVQWLLRFDGRPPAERIDAYVPLPANGEVAPSGTIQVIRNSNGRSPALMPHRSGPNVLYLDGSSPDGADGLQFTHAIPPGSSRIIEAIVAPDPSSGVGHTWSSIYSNGDIDAGGGNMIVRLMRATRQVLVVARDDANEYRYLTADEIDLVPRDGRFTHVGAVYDSERGVLEIYINRDLVASAPFRIAQGVAEPLRAIGKENSGPGGAFSGYIAAAAESTFTGAFSPSDFVLEFTPDRSPVQSESPLERAARQVRLKIPDLAWDAGAIRELPQLPSTRHPVNASNSWTDMTYHHGAFAIVWHGRIYVAWHSCARDEWTPPYMAMVAHAELDDLDNWSEPYIIGNEAAESAEYRSYLEQTHGLSADSYYFVNVCPRAFLPTEDRLYMWCLGYTSDIAHMQSFGDSPKTWVGRIFWTDDGETWNEISPFELDVYENERGMGSVRTTASNNGFTRLRNGGWLAHTLDAQRMFPITMDPTGLTGWTGVPVDVSDCDDVGEPGSWEGPDGVLHGAIRGPGIYRAIWHTYSEDGGRTWTKLEVQPGFSDCPGNKDFGQLPNGWNYYIGTPVPDSREVCVFAISRDGWNFDECYILRDEPYSGRFPSPYKGEPTGYQYPSATYHEGFIYAVYSVGRDYIELSRAEIRHILEGGK